jgi:hypothetical protein|tara:strand:- start:364 stop:570 length:207 start_codon:yes stop_codon:yes gene_type:complete
MTKAFKKVADISKHSAYQVRHSHGDPMDLAWKAIEFISNEVEGAEEEAEILLDTWYNIAKARREANGY